MHRLGLFYVEPPVKKQDACMRETPSQQVIEQKNAIKQQRTFDRFLVNDVFAQGSVKLHRPPPVYGFEPGKMPCPFQKSQVSRRGWVEGTREDNDLTAREW